MLELIFRVRGHLSNVLSPPLRICVAESQAGKGNACPGTSTAHCWTELGMLSASSLSQKPDLLSALSQPVSIDWTEILTQSCLAESR